MGADGSRHGIVLPPPLQQMQDERPLLLVFLRHFG
jgi:hypothetical protein